MPREWQQRRYKDLVMPDTVYYQTLWAVRDLQRMEERVHEMEEETLLRSKYMVSDQHADYAVYRPTEERAMELAALRERVDAIHRALDVVPKDYQSCILRSVILRTQEDDYPNKMWKYWKQRFLYTVAKNLAMI